MRRKHLRIEIAVLCLIRKLDGASYEALLDDMSLSGASVKVNSATDFQVGDKCELMLSDESAKFPVKHAGKIIWMDSDRIGVSFVL